MKKQRQFTLLIVDDEEAVINSLKRFFARYNYHILSAMNGEDALKIIQSMVVNLVILDLKMPGMEGLAVLKEARILVPNLQVIIHTGHGGVSEAVEALKHGASDFLEKGSSPEILRTRVGQAYEIWMLEYQNRELRESGTSTFSFDKFVGSSPQISRLKDLIVRVAPTDTTVLVQGESGTGKELIARAIHHHSSRSKQAFVPVDCASISESVIESELFGHVKGAFTGADAETQGLIRSADKGTLFLDEIGELSKNVQAKFLRTLQERVVRPVGATRNYPVDIRIVAATNRTLLDDVANGDFRQDLYYRLSTVTLTSPPLREREGDIDLLAEWILNGSQETNGPKVSVDQDALKMLNRYEWPGNVRELENVLKGAMVFADGARIKSDDLPPILGGGSAQQEGNVRDGTLASYELEAIRNALDLAGNNRRKAAEILGIAEATLYRKIKQFGL